MSLADFKKKYTLGAELGKGGFGIVYAAIRTCDNTNVAVKFVGRENVMEWTKLNGRKIPMEIALLEKCRQLPSVIEMLEFFELSDGFLIVMERLPASMDLFDFITTRGSLDEALARNFFKQVVETVVACATLGVVHRDIKDENLLVDLVTGRLKLIDFGSGAFLKDSDYNEFEGTRIYSPPEWLMLGSYKAIPSTVWSLGILLYVLVCGDIPWKSETEIVRGRLSWRKNVSTECKNLICGCLASRPALRLTLNKILNHPWLLECAGSNTDSSNLHQQQLHDSLLESMAKITSVHFNVGNSANSSEIPTVNQTSSANSSAFSSAKNSGDSYGRFGVEMMID